MLHLRALRISLVVAIALSCGDRGFANEKVQAKRHVVVVVWDGMRPDFVSKENTPALWKLAQEGVIFRNHHAVYPSATMVNGTALVTGIYPGKSGIIANHEYRPEIDRKHPIDVEIPAVVEKGDQLSGGKYISFPTIAELVQKAGGRTAIATTKTVGLLLDRHVDPVGPKNGVTLFVGKALPPDALAPIVAALGPFPSAHLQQDAWTTKALTELLWKEGVPAFSELWLGEPDLTEHESAPGSPSALAAIKASDENLATVLSTLDRNGVRETTDVFIVSDHGFSTIKRSIDLRKFSGMPASARRLSLPTNRNAEISCWSETAAAFYFMLRATAPKLRIVSLNFYSRRISPELFSRKSQCLGHSI